MPKYIRGVEPIAIYIGETPVLRKYLGDQLIWDGTRSIVAQAQRAHATVTARPATPSASAMATAVAATANASANAATVSASVDAGAAAAAMTAVVNSAQPHASAAATAVSAYAYGQVLDVVAEQTFDALANATAATATAAVVDAQGSADAMADAVAASMSSMIVYDALGQGSVFVDATAATATAAVNTAQPVTNAAVTAVVATAAAAGKSATPSASSTATATAATATAAANSATASAVNAFIDNFNRTAGTSLGSAWTETGNDVGIVSNQLAVQGTSASPSRRGAIYNTATATPYQSVQFTIGTTPNTSTGSGAILRCNSGMTQMVMLSVASNGWNLGRITGINGTFTSIASASVTVAAGDVIKVEVDAENKWRVYINGVKSGTTVVDSTWADSSHQYLGLHVQRVSTTNSAALDDFVAKDTPPMQLVASDNFNRASLGSSWNLAGGGSLFISSNEISGLGTPSEPMSYAFWSTPVGSDTQIVRATVRWAGHDPAHSAAAVVLRANPSLMPAVGASGVQFWFVNNLMGILYEDSGDPDGFTPAVGTADYVSTSKFAEGAIIELRAEAEVYTASVNGVQVLQGTVSNSIVPTSRRYVGVMIQDDSAVSGGGDHPADLDDWLAYII